MNHGKRNVALEQTGVCEKEGDDLPKNDCAEATRGDAKS